MSALSQADLDRPATREELLRARSDFPFFARRFLRIARKDGELCQFEFNQAQDEIWKAITSQLERDLPVRIAVLKCRQAGVSTFVQALSYWQAVTRRNLTSVCMAHRSESAENIFRTAKRFYELQPPPKPETRYSTRKELSFAGGLGSRIIVLSANTYGGSRSYTIQFLHLSEVSLYPRPEELVQHFLPSLPELPGTWCIMESTGRGGDDYWYHVWVDSLEGRSGFVPVFVPWYWISDYCLDGAALSQWLDDPDDLEADEEVLRSKGLSTGQIAWRRMMVTRIGYERFRCEYPSTWQDAFSRAADSVFSHERVVSAFVERPPVFVGEIDLEVSSERRPVLSQNRSGRLLVWEHPQQGVEYCIGVDTSVGVSTGSYSVMEVVRYDGDRWHQVAEWRGHSDPVQFASYVEALARYYNDAILTIELQMTGFGVQAAVANHYHRFFRWRKWDEPGLPPTKKLGWSTQPSTKPLLIGFFKHVVESGSFRFHSPVLYEELLNFIDDGGSLGAAPGSWDDTVMAAAMAVFGHWIEIRPVQDQSLEKVVMVHVKETEEHEGDLDDREGRGHVLRTGPGGPTVAGTYRWDDW